ncbi:MAG: DUF2085 domain-containing protein [Thermoflexales bacterium]|nr:DUF2085 domain-containing protein [Thermoflexales bacterium]
MTAQPRNPIRVVNRWPFIILAAAAAAGLLFPQVVGQAANLVGYAVCHRIPARSFILDGNQLPLCARDTGMFLAALVTIGFYVAFDSRRVSLFPRFPQAFVLLALAAAWAFDGFNSYYLLARNEMLFYMPNNLLRLITGAGMGVALGAFVVPLVNSSLWKMELLDEVASVANWRDVFVLLGLAALVTVVVGLQPDFLYGPLALLSGLGAFGLLAVVSGLLVLQFRKQNNRFSDPRALWGPAAVGLFIAFNEVMAIVLLRQWLTVTYNLPF